MEYKPINTKKSYEEIADTLIHSIKVGELKPGDKLDSIEQLSKSFEVSRSVIREALSGMRAMGLIEVKQGEGTYIAHFNPANFNLPVRMSFLMKREDVKDLFEVRKILEVGSAKTAAINHNESDLLKIKESLNQMKLINRENGKHGEIADFKFHLSIAEATHNRILINLLNSVSDIMHETIRESRKLIFYSGDNGDQLQKEHQLIYEAIKARKAEEAQTYMLNHLQGVENLVLNYIERK